MKRKMTEKLMYWEKNQSDKPLMLLGARQIGKTYILDDFCSSNFSNYVYINLEKEVEIRDIFDQTIDPKSIVNAISILKNVDIEKEDSVIFIDEIQESERAISSLKYFAEARTDYKVVCAGSVLGVALNRMSSSFPVGKIYRQYMFPMDFEEFLWAIGEEKLSKTIRASYSADIQMLKPLHERALELHKYYLYIGGMPASINEFIRAKLSLSSYDDSILDSILEDYISDMNRYTTRSDAIKINKIYKSIPKHLGKENSKFTYKLVDDNGSKRYFQKPIDWLIYSYIIQKCSLVKLPKIPLRAYSDESSFKIYASDVGILARLSKFTKNDLYSVDLNLFSGMLAENYVANTLTRNGFELSYWRSKYDAEIDFVINLDGDVIPIEVKASQNTKSKSLNVYIDKYKPRYAIRISSKNFGFINGIKSLPIYATHLIENQS